MTLLEIRTQFIKESGRFDLVVDTSAYADNGANYYITAGQRFLDGLYTNRKDKQELVESVDAGDYLIELSGVVAVEKVLLNTSTGSVYLTPMSLKGLKELFGYNVSALSAVEQDEPAYYAIGILRDGTPTAAKSQKAQVIIMPPADATYSVTITTKSYSDALSADGDSNFWSLEFPHLLVLAAQYMLERAYRNTEGANDYLNSIMLDMKQLDYEVVEQDQANVNKMTNSW